MYIFIVFFLIALAFFCLFQFGFLSNFSGVKFDKDKLSTTSTQITIFDNEGRGISNNYVKTNIKIEEIPQSTIDAFTSIEDKNFYKHHGLNYKRIVKAMTNNIFGGKISEGASTISQQVIKNTHLSSEKTFKRKFNEVILTKEMEKQLTKDEIMTAYLNAIYFGSGAFGINSAAQRFYSKSCKDLNLNESATLAGIIKSPKLYSPINSTDNCIKRRNLVLKEMLKDGKITKDEYNDTTKKSLELKLDEKSNGNNYYKAVINEACNILRITEKDLLLSKYKIYTYLNNELQLSCEKKIDSIEDITSSKNIDGAILIMDNKTGGIKAFSSKSIYNVLDMKRQPGSTLKPLISYGPAIENNEIYPITKILDEKISFGSYTPHNYKNVYHGYVSAKEALAKSYNIPSIKILQTVGVDKAKEFASRLGVKFNRKDEGLSLAVGAMTDGIDILSLTNAYQPLGNNGNFVKARFIKSIKSDNGKVIYQNMESNKKVMKDSTAFLLSDMLRDGVLNGTSKALNLKNKYICAKTGTVASPTDKSKNSDVWSVSYSKDNTMCCWLGATGDEQILSSVTGASGPCLMAKNIYEKTDLSSNKIEKPDSVDEKYVNEIEYLNNKVLLSNEETPDRYKFKAYFSKDNCPTLYDNMFDEIKETTLYARKTETNSIMLEFDAKKYLVYKLYRLDEDETNLIKEIKNKDGNVSIEDKDTKLNTFYTYYLKVEYLNNDILRNDIVKESNKIKMYLS